jgi:DNA-binding IclR family transcriptional regulator
MGQAPLSRYGLLVTLQRVGPDGLTRTEIARLFPDGFKPSRIDRLLKGLADRGLVESDGERWVAR